MKPGQPATYARSVVIVLAPELSPKMTFLVENDEEVEDDHHDDGIEEHGGRAKEEGPAQNHGERADVHWISGVTIETSHDELLGRIDRRGGAPPECGEIPDAPGVDA